MGSVRWNVAVSPDTDQAVRMFLASQGGGRKGDLSRFIEDAARAFIFDRVVAQAKAANADVSEADLTAIVNEAAQWAREPLREVQEYPPALQITASDWTELPEDGEGATDAGAERPVGGVGY